MKQDEEQLLSIGWREWLSLPDIGVPGIKAKIDTGARTSCLHTHDFEEFEKAGSTWVRFHLHPLTHFNEIELTCEAPVHEYKEVKDSGGHIEYRPFIQTTACIGGYKWEIDLSLSNREGMKFRMLLGRKALANRFLVNPEASYLIGKNLENEYRR
jgi:hypothetical protein